MKTKVSGTALIRNLSTLPKHKRIVLYCEDGKIACPRLAKDLEKRGVTKIFVLESGWLRIIVVIIVFIIFRQG